MKVMSIVGARPQFIKSFAFSHELKKHDDIEEIIVHTGQHYDENMSKIFFDELGMKKEDYNLNINNGTHAELTGKMLIELEKIMLKEKPEVVVLFGDTDSTLAGSLAAAKLNIDIAHIEAGFRAFDKTIPEEINRIVTDHLSKYLFCPTESTVHNLKNEGIVKNVYLVGDIMYDAAMLVKDVVEQKSDEILHSFDLNKNDYFYATVHRNFNTDDPKRLKNIFDALLESKETIVLPLHPRTKKKLIDFGLYEKYTDKNIRLIPPVGYLESQVLINNCKKVVTDSGGLLKEAYYYRKPCIVLRENVEFKEMIEFGGGILVGADKEKIIDAINQFVGSKDYDMIFSANTAKKIVDVLTRNENLLF